MSDTTEGELPVYNELCIQGWRQYIGTVKDILQECTYVWRKLHDGLGREPLAKTNKTPQKWFVKIEASTIYKGRRHATDGKTNQGDKCYDIKHIIWVNAFFGAACVV